MSGLRFAVKDVVNVVGLIYGLRQRSLDSDVPPTHTNGTAGVSSRGCRRGTDDEMPGNLRGDGFQKPSSYSPGSGAALAAYPWLNPAIETGTDGSVRRPAGVHGISGLRSSLADTTLRITATRPEDAPADTEEATKHIHSRILYVDLHNNSSGSSPGIIGQAMRSRSPSSSRFSVQV
ncbi:hypothetical protein MAPG_04304 [Magnaporthiopsis poae ATCC 64411]|uniref:Amidase domain-containing protein n=1 Tax=Magnaporthiopsis poae (strain ATCC 64411 / 73-15) TaxID=644358 RepID=A0A0C4DWC8_MAGP6|nr:hypothetical protein MAPG_04304 [Magnaporthiopsis poae ATCC 64411]